jgi:hypothetical protein
MWQLVFYFVLLSGGRELSASRTMLTNVELPPMPSHAACVAEGRKQVRQFVRRGGVYLGFECHRRS